MTNIFEHYRSLYGEPIRKAEFKSPDGGVVQVFKWDERQTDEGVTMYATLGANRILGDTSESCEFFIGMTPSADSIADALAEIALHGNGTMDIPNGGDTTTLAYELWAGTQAKTFMFTDGDEIISPIKDESGRQVWFIQLVPLFERELAYKMEHGEEALWDKFEEVDAPYWDSTRKSALQQRSSNVAKRGWKVGDDVYSPTAKGTDSTWSTVRSRNWKNEAAAPGAAEKYGAENLPRMSKGGAPQRYNADKGGVESMELSHEPIPARDGGKEFVPRWPQDHAAVDPHRKVNY